MKEIKWGLIFVVAIILWMIIERLAGLHTHNIQYHAIFTNVFAVVTIVIYILATRQKSVITQSGNDMVTRFY